ncbi:MAG: hypothetical protein GWN00_12105 [Aliifodinibius sp.]|nr:hypothetical protein [Fodinibius sp.]NIY25523.1 hypothetical protein [Fodinibius sp.]
MRYDKNTLVFSMPSPPSKTGKFSLIFDWWATIYSIQIEKLDNLECANFLNQAKSKIGEGSANTVLGKPKAQILFLR